VSAWYAARAASVSAGGFFVPRLTVWESASDAAWCAAAAAATAGLQWDDPAWDDALRQSWFAYDFEPTDDAAWEQERWEAACEFGRTGFPSTFSGWRTEREAQARLLRDVFGAPTRPAPAFARSWLAWNDGTARKMAQTIYQHRRFADLPILADALEDAGCADADVLTHCRGGEHVRGCWVVDLLLNKI
jgi:hypothetical protein